ncbi:MAG: serine/threonine protein kinase [Spirochaetales bacterium]|nr:serine/threonine protein kinase [Spirochaetales bacterium]
MAELPEFIGKYKIESLVARGGMGAVLKAIHPTLRRYVVLKKLTIRGSSAIAERFKREARILIDFKHENIVRVFDHFKEGNSNYMVLEYVDGMSLDQLIKKQRFLSCELALTILRDACKALSYAHGQGVIHRDIKPANILISRKGDVKLADFGIATFEEDDDSGLTKEGMTLGTPCYMPPEQIENSKNVDRRADIYALGVMLYEMVTGKKPYPGNFSAETLIMVRKGKFRRAAKLNAKVSPFVDKLIRKLMRPNPAKRPQEVDAVIRRVEAHLKRWKPEPVREALAGLMKGTLAEEPHYPRGRRRNLLVPALAALSLALVAGAYAAWTKGYIHRWILPGSYGLLRLELRVPRDGRPADDIFLRARIFIDDGDELPELEVSPVELEVAPTEDADPYHSFASEDLFLPPGAYRIKLAVGGSVLWESCELPALAKPEGKEGITLHYRLDEEAPRPLRVTATARDALTGAQLEHVKLSVLVDGIWLAQGALPAGWLTTGAVRHFRVYADGYAPQAFSLRIAPDQDRLTLLASLRPAR